MELSAEDKKKIYEEEKARIEAEQKAQPQKPDEGPSTVNLEPNVAGLLCYVGFWVSGVVFLALEQKNRFIRFHAIQSVIVFGFLAIVGSMLGSIPIAGPFFGAGVGIFAFILWIILMVNAHDGRLYKLPPAGDWAAKISGATTADEFKPQMRSEQTAGEDSTTRESTTTPKAPVAAAVPVSTEKKGHKRSDDVFERTRGGRVASSSAAIAWSVVVFIFFNFFSQYIKYYQMVSTNGVNVWTSYPILQPAGFASWLIVLDISLALTVIGHIILIIFDKYVLREAIHIVLNVFGMIVIGTLLAIFPFDFSQVPNTVLFTAAPIGIISLLAFILVILVIATIVRFIKLIVNIARRTPEY
jgi:uncharacterized membrane protein